MTKFFDRIGALDWRCIGAQLDACGHAHLPALIPSALATQLTAIFTRSTSQQLTLDTAEVEPVQTLPLGAPLIEPLQQLRAALYEQLRPVALRWAGCRSRLPDATSGEPTSPRLSPFKAPPATAHAAGHHAPPAIDRSPISNYPPSLDEFLRANMKFGQHQPLSHLQRLGAGGRVALHRSREPMAFPFALTALLAASQDLQGGEWVGIEQRPRMQSRPMVKALQPGDALIVSTGPRPLRTATGHTTATLQHGVSRVRGGSCISLQLFFHHALASNA